MSITIISIAQREINKLSIVNALSNIFFLTPPSGCFGWAPSSNLGNLEICVFVSLRHYTCCNIIWHPKQGILVDPIFNYYRFRLGLPGKCLYFSPQNTPPSAPEMHIFRTFLKTCSWSPKWNLQLNMVSTRIYCLGRPFTWQHVVFLMKQKHTQITRFARCY